MGLLERIKSRPHEATPDPNGRDNCATCGEAIYATRPIVTMRYVHATGPLAVRTFGPARDLTGAILTR